MSSIRIITITGESATGKSTIAKALLDRLPGWTRANTGGKFREVCAEHGFSIQDVSTLPDEVHREIDSWQKSLAQNESHMIIEGRLAGWLTRDMPHVFRVYCETDLDVRVQRYMKREGITSEHQSRKEITERDHLDLLKYRKTYDLYDYRDPNYYNIRLDTSDRTPEALAQSVLEQSGIAPQLTEDSSQRP